MTRHIGIVACSAEGAALCYRTICFEGTHYMGRHAHPEVSLHNYPLSTYMHFIDPGDWDGVAKLMLSSVKKVAAQGASFAICPDNTIHQALDKIIDQSPIPWLHIAEEVALEAKHKGYTRIGVLGTKYLMEGPVYSQKLELMGLESMIPTEDERIKINAIIFDELVYGKFTVEAREYFNTVIQCFKTQGCEAVILGCTEIPLLIEPDHSSLPTLDSTRLLARAALRKAIE